MPKHYKDMIDELINKMDEDAPANAVAHGGVDMAPNAKGRATHNKSKYKDDNEKTTDILRRTIMKKMGNNVKENFDNNNVVLKGINETLNKLEDKIDEKNGVKKEEEFGLRTLLDVLDIEVDVMNSEVRLLKSKSDQLLNKYKLLIDIGKYNF